MHGLTGTGIVVAVVAILLLGVHIGWGAGRKFQRAVDRWRWFRWQLSMAFYTFRMARYAAVDAAKAILLALVVIVVVGGAAWVLIT